MSTQVEVFQLKEFESDDSKYPKKLNDSDHVGERRCQEVPTWHDDIREAQFPGDGHTASEEDHVLPPQLLYVPVEELQSHCQA